MQFVASLILSGLAFMLLYAAMDAAIYLKLVDFVTGFRNAMSATDSLTFITAKHVSESRPWEWAFNLEIMPYWYGPHYIGLVSFPVWALIVPTVVYTAFRSIKKDTAALFSIASFIGVYRVDPTDIATNRISFIYYFLRRYPASALVWNRHGLSDQLLQAPRPPRTPRVKAPPQAAPSCGRALRRRTASPDHPRRARPSSRLPPVIERAAGRDCRTGTGLAAVEPPKRRRKTKLQWAAVSFVAPFSCSSSLRS